MMSVWATVEMYDEVLNVIGRSGISFCCVVDDGGEEEEESGGDVCSGTAQEVSESGTIFLFRC
jgi:hypothetical protein